MALSGGEVQAREALGRSQGGFSTKLHLRAEGNGRPITAVLTGGERHEQMALEALLDRGAVHRPSRGRPRLRPRRTAGDKGYSSPTARGRLRRRHIRAVIRSKSNQRRQPNFDRAAYRRRNRVERLINRLKQFRRIATRYEKRRSEEHTSELQSRQYLVCRLLLEKKKTQLSYSDASTLNMQ